MGSSCYVGVQQIFSPEMPNAAFQHELILIRKRSGFAKRSCGIIFFFSEELAASLLSAGAKGEQEGGMCSQMLPLTCFRRMKNKSAFLALGERHKQHVKLVFFHGLTNTLKNEQILSVVICCHLYEIQALEAHEGDENIDSRNRVCLVVTRGAAASREGPGSRILCCIQVLLVVLGEAVGWSRWPPRGLQPLPGCLFPAWVWPVPQHLVQRTCSASGWLRGELRMANNPSITVGTEDAFPLSWLSLAFLRCLLAVGA